MGVFRCRHFDHGVSVRCADSSGLDVNELAQCGHSDCGGVNVYDVHQRWCYCIGESVHLRALTRIVMLTMDFATSQANIYRKGDAVSIATIQLNANLL